MPCLEPRAQVSVTVIVTYCRMRTQNRTELTASPSPDKECSGKLDATAHVDY